MKKFEVTFYGPNDESHTKTFEYSSVKNLIKFINEQHYIHIPGSTHDIKMKKWKSHSVLYMNSVTSLSIKEILYEEDNSSDEPMTIKFR